MIWKHFLTGRPLNCLPEPADEVDNQINCWKRIQAVQKSFWSRWKREYLVSLQERQKWIKPTEKIKSGSLVLIQEDKLHPNQWLLGRIVETHTSKDGLIRVVSIKTRTGILKRNIHRICPLPTEV